MLIKKYLTCCRFFSEQTYFGETEFLSWPDQWFCCQPQQKGSRWRHHYHCTCTDESSACAVGLKSPEHMCKLHPTSTRFAGKMENKRSRLFFFQLQLEYWEPHLKKINKMMAAKWSFCWWKHTRTQTSFWRWVDVPLCASCAQYTTNTMMWKTWLPVIQCVTDTIAIGSSVQPL